MSNFSIEPKVLWDAFGDKLKTDKKDFYRKILVLKEESVWSEEFAKVFPEAAKYSAMCYYRPSPNDMRMHALDELLETSGIEYMDCEETKNGEYVDYLNVGDPYVPTVVYCGAWSHPFRFVQAGYASLVK